jgi:CSLREA domain-containing protein
VRRRLSFALACVLVLAAVLPAAAAAEVFTVTTSADSNTGNCTPASCTLRQAVAKANSVAGNNVIVVPAGTYTLSFGQLSLQRDVTIEGAGPEVTKLNGNSASRVLEITVGHTAHIEGLAVEGGQVLGTSASEALGGGIRNVGTLFLDDVAVRGNRVAPADSTGTIPEGGGIFNAGVLHVADSIISGNEATSLPYSGGIPSGGGIDNQAGRIDVVDSTIAANKVSAEALPGGAGIASYGGSPHGATVELTRTKVEGNQALDPVIGGVPAGAGLWVESTDLTLSESSVRDNAAIGGSVAEGAGIYAIFDGDLAIERSTIAGNVAEAATNAEGGALFSDALTNESLLVVDSTVFGNRATGATRSLGGGLYHTGAAPLRVVASTIDANTASGNATESKGGNVFDEGSSESATILRDSIVSAGTAAPAAENCNGAGVKSAGHNLDSTIQCNFGAVGDKQNAEPLLGPLGDNGGPTATQALDPASPAIDAGTDCPPTDQRGVARPQGAGCDIGAFELVPAPPVRQDATTAPPAAALRVLPGLRLAAKAKIDLLSGKGALQAHCTAAPTDSCSVKLALLFKDGRKAVKVGSVNGKLGGGKAGKLSVKLTHKGLALLAEQPGQRLSVKTQGSSKDTSGASLTVKATLVLEGKSPSPHSK